MNVTQVAQEVFAALINYDANAVMEAPTPPASLEHSDDLDTDTAPEFDPPQPPPDDTHASEPANDDDDAPPPPLQPRLHGIDPRRAAVSVV